MTQYALFKDGIQVSKAHVSKEAVDIEAFEAGAIMRYSADFIGDKSGQLLCSGYEIKEIDE